MWGPCLPSGLIVKVRWEMCVLVGGPNTLGTNRRCSWFSLERIMSTVAGVVCQRLPLHLLTTEVITVKADSRASWVKWRIGGLRGIQVQAFKSCISPQPPFPSSDLGRVWSSLKLSPELLLGAGQWAPFAQAAPSLQTPQGKHVHMHPALVQLLLTVLGGVETLPRFEYLSKCQPVASVLSITSRWRILETAFFKQKSVCMYKSCQKEICMVVAHYRVAFKFLS